MKRAFLSAAAVLCLMASAQAEKKMVHPIIPKVGGVVPLPNAAE